MKKQLLSNLFNPLLIIILLLFVVSGFTVLFRDIKTAVIFSAIDDGLYYTKIAQNFFIYKKFTYDGTTITNGFHPLWEIILLPIYYIIKDPISALKVLFWLIEIALIGTSIIFYKITKLLNFSKPGLFISFVIIFINFRSLTLFFSLMEAPLVLCLNLLLLKYTIANYGNRNNFSYKIAFFNGLFFGVLFLARADYFLLPLSYGLFLTHHYLKKHFSLQSYLGQSFFSFLGTFIIITPYLILNYIYFGHIFTVSSWRKIAAPSLETLKLPLIRVRDLLCPRIAYVFGIPDKFNDFIFLLISLSLMCMFIFFITGKRIKVVKEFFTKFPDFSLFVLLHFSFTFIFVPEEALFSIWYYVPEIIFFGLLAGRYISFIGSHLISKVSFGIAVFLTIFQFFYYNSFVEKKSITTAKIEVAEFINRYLPAKANFSMYDSGILSYFSQRNFFAINGLIGDFEMAKLCNNSFYQKFLKRYSINYIVVNSSSKMYDHNQDKIIYTSRLQAKFDDYSKGLEHIVVVKLNPKETNPLINQNILSE
jgi:hypothetical protein